MVNFVGLLKRTIDAQSNATPVLRRRIYERTRETVERQMAGKDIAPDIKALQYRILEKAINDVESHYQQFDNQAYLSSSQKGRDNFVSPLPKNANVKTHIQSPLAHNNSFSSAADPYNINGREENHLSDIPSFAGQNSADFDKFPPVNNAGYNGNYAGRAENISPSAAPQTRNKNNGRDDGLFRLSEDQEAGTLAPYGYKEGRETSYHPYESASQIRNQNFAANNGAFARHNLDEPAPFPADFEENSSNEQQIQNTPADAFPQNMESHYHNSKIDEDFGRSYDEPYNTSPDFNAYNELDNRAAESAVNKPSMPSSSYHSPSSYNIAEETVSENFEAEEIFHSSENFSSLESRHHTEEQMPYAGDFPALDDPLFPPEKAQNSHDGMEPLPDFLSTKEDSAPYNAHEAAEEENAFYLEQALAAQNEIANSKKQKRQELPLPEDLHNIDYEPDGDVLLPELKTDQAKAAGSADGHIASGIFAQAAIQEKRRSGRRRLMTGGAIILTLLVIFAGIFWFLTDFLKSDKHKIATLTGKNPAVNEEVEKTNQRLTADGQEVEVAPQPQTNTAETTAQSHIDANAESAAPQQTGVVGKALFREAQTALMPATTAQGEIRWSLLHEKSPDGIKDTVLRGELNIPDRDFVMRMTIRPNHDKGIPAVYLVELMFVVPENFEGTAIDKISPLMFKATEQSTSQELLDTRVYKINDNFFVVTLNSPQGGLDPKLQRNIALMEQLPWLSLNVAYKNGRIGEFIFAKGDEGDALFKQFFDEQADAVSSDKIKTQPTAKTSGQ